MVNMGNQPHCDNGGGEEAKASPLPPASTSARWWALRKPFRLQSIILPTQGGAPLALGYDDAGLPARPKTGMLRRRFHGRSSRPPPAPADVAAVVEDPPQAGAMALSYTFSVLYITPMISFSLRQAGCSEVSLRHLPWFRLPFPAARHRPVRAARSSPGEWSTRTNRARRRCRSRREDAAH